MTAQKGKDLLIKIADSAGYATVAGLRTRRLAFNAETVDVTHAESANRWRELLDGAGVKRAAVSGRCLFKDASTDALMRQTFFDGRIASYQVVIPSFGTVQGPFQITGLEFAGEHNGEMTYDMIPDVTVRTIATAGHMLPFTHCSELLPLIVDHCGGRRGRRAERTHELMDRVPA